jgi:hypothetical protein
MWTEFVKSLTLAVFSALFSTAAWAADCQVIDFLYGQATPETQAMVDLMNGQSANKSLLEKLGVQLSRAGCVAVLSEVPSHQVATLAWFFRSAGETLGQIKGHTQVFSRILDKTMPAGCETMEALDAETRILRCYGYVPESSTVRDGGAYGLVTYYAGSGSNLTEALREAGQVTEGALAYQDTVLERAVETNGLKHILVTVNESLLLTGKKSHGGLVLLASGFVPNLTTPFLWMRRAGTARNHRAEKIVAAALFLHDRDLAFADINVGSGKAQIVHRSTFQKPMSMHLMGYDLEAALDAAMAEQGFEFSDGKWRNASRTP